MSCFKRGPGANKFPDLTDVPVVNSCEGFGYKAPFRKEIPFKLVFVTQWYNEKVEIEKRLMLSYFHFDGTIELKDLDRQKLFLRRTKLENVKLQDLFVGNKLFVLARHLIILDYGDGITKDYCDPLCERAFLLVRPEAVDNLPCIVQRLEKCFRILFAKMARISKGMAYELCKTDEGVKQLSLKSIQSLNGKVVVAFFLMAEKAMEKLKNLVGEDLDPQECLLKNHQSLRALYGHDKMMNGFYYSDTPECVIKDASFFFSGCPRCTLPSEMRLEATTCCVIKPHIVREGRAGIVLGDVVASGFQITGFGIFWLNKRQAEEFYEIYKRIYVESEYLEMVDEISIGPCIAVELAIRGCDQQCNPPNAVDHLRQCAGPPDPDLARKVRPQTLRARHGLTKAQNAIHCTDLPEDAVSEVDFYHPKTIKHIGYLFL